MSDGAMQEMTLAQAAERYGKEHRAYKEYNQLVYDLDKARADRTKVENERDELAKSHKQLREALSGLWMHLDSGTLCRDTSKDHHDDWAIRASALVTDLARAKKALDQTT